MSILINTLCIMVYRPFTFNNIYFKHVWHMTASPFVCFSEVALTADFFLTSGKLGFLFIAFCNHHITTSVAMHMAHPAFGFRIPTKQH